MPMPYERPRQRQGVLGYVPPSQFRYDNYVRGPSGQMGSTTPDGRFIPVENRGAVHDDYVIGPNGQRGSTAMDGTFVPRASGGAVLEGHASNGPYGGQPRYTPADRAYMAQSGDPNAGLRAAVNRFSSQGAAMAQRPSQPYQPSNNTGPGAYVNGLRHAQDHDYGDGSYQGGLMTNYGASLGVANTGYMPNKTVGGGYGNPGGYDSDYAVQAGQRAAGIAARGPGAVATDMRSGVGGYGILGAKAHSSYGATSGTVIDSTGRPRPGWVDNYSGNTGAVGEADVRRGLDAVYNQGGRVISPSGQMRLSPGSEQYEATQRAGEVFDARRGGLAARVADYEARTAEAKQFREGNRVARGIQRGQRMTDSLDMRRGNMSMDERFMFQNPQAYARTVEAKNMGQYQQGLLGVQRDATASRERIAGMQGQNAMGLAQLAGQNAMGLAGVHGQTQKDVAALQGQNAMGVAGLNATTQKDLAGIQGETAMGVAKENNAGRRDEVAIRRDEMAMRRADSMRAQADQAYASGDIQRGQRLERQANNLEVGIGRGDGGGGILDMAAQQAAQIPTGNAGVAAAAQGAIEQGGGQPPQGNGLLGHVGPQAWAQLPFQAREQIRGNSPMEMVQNIRNMMPNLPQAAMDQMVAEAYPGTSASQYNPDGYGLLDFVGGLTGLENVNRFGRAASRQGPRPPMMNVPFIGERPIPVIPGIGWAQTRAGY